MAGIEVIDPRYRPLLERTHEVLGADARVRSVALGGSVGAGTADRWSDLDFAIATDPEQHDDFLRDWPDWLGRITPTVFARTPIAPFIINAVTQDGLTVDFVVWSGEVPEFRPPAGLALGLSTSRFDNIGDALDYAVAEQLRGLAGPFISLLQRGEHLKHLSGVPHVLGLLTTVFLAETGHPAPSKRWNPSYTDEQLRAVATLPPVRATAEDLKTFGLGVARLIVERGRPLFPRYDLVWPAALAKVAAIRLEENLGINTSGWLG
ncbi:nucleotidyltransferase domain-containing protein [Microlunatus sp. Gsoil 973]|uniref:nucleotidyltransferase domain-containing protein n=1 Tax=Microlunatus sp. Gsoil 973 TaxID=2672569 RepID=UPI0012B48D0D|nr:nucleotidyltransferase domain-containing protein [Microlunatus sp. Gsoil 973]QGN33251.1 hypothetical protein GJV80_11055 [Microlunatus sp. Gsoil 973]